MRRAKRIVEALKEFFHVDAAERQWVNLETGLDSILNIIWSQLEDKTVVIENYGKTLAVDALLPNSIRGS